MTNALVKTELFAKFVDQQFETYKTEFQINYLFGSYVEELYLKDNEIYVRTYIDNLPSLQDQDYNLTYITMSEPIYDEDRKIAILGYTTRDITESELSEKFEKHWENVRTERNRLLEESDRESMIYLPDYWSQKTDEYKNDWLAYRQQLRDITQSTDNPFEVTWPIKPLFS